MNPTPSPERPEHTPTVILGFASWSDRRFELIVRDEESWEETTLYGTLKEGQFEIIDRILPTCVFVKARVATRTAPEAVAGERCPDCAGEPCDKHEAELFQKGGDEPCPPSAQSAAATMQSEPRAIQADCNAPADVQSVSQGQPIPPVESDKDAELARLRAEYSDALLTISQKSADLTTARATIAERDQRIAELVGALNEALLEVVHPPRRALIYKALAHAEQV